MPSSNSIGTGGCFSGAAGALSDNVGVSAGGGGGTVSAFSTAGSGIAVTCGGGVDAQAGALVTARGVAGDGFETAAASGVGEGAGEGAGETAGLTSCWDGGAGGFWIWIGRGGASRELLKCDESRKACGGGGGGGAGIW